MSYDLQTCAFKLPISGQFQRISVMSPSPAAADMTMPRTQPPMRCSPRSFHVLASHIWNTMPLHLKDINPRSVLGDKNSPQLGFASVKNSVISWAKLFCNFSWIWMEYKTQLSDRRSVHQKFLRQTHELFWNCWLMQSNASKVSIVVILAAKTKFFVFCSWQRQRKCPQIKATLTDNRK